jgi:hypothetical protein
LRSRAECLPCLVSIIWGLWIAALGPRSRADDVDDPPAGPASWPGRAGHAELGISPCPCRSELPPFGNRAPTSPPAAQTGCPAPPLASRRPSGSRARHRAPRGAPRAARARHRARAAERSPASPHLPEHGFPPTLRRSANSRSRPKQRGAAPHTRLLRAGSVRARQSCTGHRCRVLSLLVALLGSNPASGSASLPPSRPPEESPSWQPLMPPGRAAASRV